MVNPIPVVKSPQDKKAEILECARFDMILLREGEAKADADGILNAMRVDVAVQRLNEFHLIGSQIIHLLTGSDLDPLSVECCVFAHMFRSFVGLVDLVDLGKPERENSLRRLKGSAVLSGMGFIADCGVNPRIAIAPRDPILSIPCGVKLAAVFGLYDAISHMSFSCFWFLIY